MISNNYNMKTMDLSTAIDWFSIKLMGISIALAVINWNKITGILSVIALTSTIIYNVVKIYKEFKNKNNT